MNGGHDPHSAERLLTNLLTVNGELAHPPANGVSACRMADSFGQFLSLRLGLMSLSQNQFARQVGRSGAFISFVIAGERLPPLEDLERWSIELRLSREDRAHFRDLADLAHTPTRIREQVEKLRARVRELERHAEEQRKKAMERVDQAREFAAMREENRNLKALLEAARRQGYRL